MLFDPHGPEFWVMISFIGFVALILYYRVPAIIGRALDARAEAIRKELDEARRLREEAQALLADYQRKSREAEDEAKSIIDQAKREAEILADETRKSLQESLERRTKAAEEKIARAEAQAISDVRATAVDTALAASQKILSTKVTGDTGNTLIDESIRNLKSKLN
jgi:F-type H+-transporting ATPase subunit b